MFYYEASKDWNNFHITVWERDWDSLEQIEKVVYKNQELIEAKLRAMSESPEFTAFKDDLFNEFADTSDEVRDNPERFNQ